MSAKSSNSAKSPNTSKQLSLTTEEWEIFNDLEDYIPFARMEDELAIERLTQREKYIYEIGLIIKYGVTY